MKAQDARWMRVRDLFEQAIELPAHQRESFIDKNCAGDDSLRDELQALVASDLAHSKSPLTSAIGAAVDATTRERRHELLGTVIGPYRLTSVLGHGGAGTVYLGERVDRQYSAQVAVKVVEGAALHAEISRRFRAERQILANLNHPHIARLIDAGETPQGFPYLVMEYVHGEPIHQYCDRLQLSLDERVSLLLKVCAAVHYAHQNLVVHRDLKPGNILVTPDGTPKLLDFGIAKLLDTGDTAAEMALTRLNDRILTPEYASPEQILGQTVTTSSDVYALGVVLYELLTGLRPYKVSSASQLELERTICITDPARPSTAVREALLKLSDDPPPTRNIHTVAEARGTTPMRLRSLLNGDLDAILLRALRKEPVHRYNSIEQFAADLRRHLARAPVLAREGNWVYYAQRFTRRHIFGVSVTAGFIVVLAAALIVTSIQAKRIAEQRDAANREKQTSEAVANFMLNVFAAADPFTVQDKQVTAGELLDRAAKNIHEDLDQQPAVKARLLEAIGRSYQRQGHANIGIGLLEEALQIRRRQEGGNNPALVPTLSNLARAQLFQSETAAAKASLEEAHGLLEKAGKKDSAEYAHILADLSRVEYERGETATARQRIEEALPLLKKHYGTKHIEVASALTLLGYILQWQGDFTEMEHVAAEAVATYQSSTPELHPDRMLAEGLLAESLFGLGRIDEAAPQIERVFAAKKKVFGEKSSRIADELQLLVRLRRAQNRLDDAESFARESLSIKLQTLGEQNQNTAYARTTLAVILWQLDKPTEAERELRSALVAYKKLLPAENLQVASANHYLAETLLSQNRINEAQEQAKQTLLDLEKADAVPWRLARTQSTFAQSLVASNRLDEAQHLLETSYRLLSESTGVEKHTVALARDRLANLYKIRGELTKLRALNSTDNKSR